MKNNNINQGFKLFLELKHNFSNDSDYVIVEPVPCSQSHKIGISDEGYPMFFIKCNDIDKSIDINLELISVLFSRNCSVKEKQQLSNEIFTLIVLKTKDVDLQKYFIDVITLILSQINSFPSEKELYKEIKKVINLFSSLTLPPIKTIQGLWAELLIIDKSKNPEVLINAWHVSPNDKYDFNDGSDKLEVKSTSTQKRVHSFSSDQLCSNFNSQLIIASIFVIQSGIGLSVLDLRDRIMTKVKDFATQIRFNEIILKTVGCQYTSLSEMMFDYQLASDSISYFDSVNIPKISKESIPSEVTNLHYDCDLSNVAAIQLENIKGSNGLLLSNIGI